MKGSIQDCEAPRRHALLWAALSAALVLAWWAATVRSNYGGNWTALYCSGEFFRTPPQLASENIHRRPSTGFDGQFYHYLAHDPMMRWSMPYIDVPGLRAKRILVPALAHVLFAGRAVDTAYLAVTLAFVFLGVFWLARWAQVHGRDAAWGLLFLVSGATVAAIDNLTVDVALAALSIGFVYARRLAPRLAAASLAGLARETGVLVAGAGMLAALRKREWRNAALFAAAVVPAALWNAWLWSNTPQYRFPASWVPFAAVVRAVLNPVRYEGYPAALAAFAAGLHFLAIAGAVMAIFLAVRLALRRAGALGWTVLLFAVLSLFVQQTMIWASVYGFARVYAPLYLLMAAHGLASRERVYLLPLLLMAPRCLLMFGPQALGIVRSL